MPTLVLIPALAAIIYAVAIKCRRKMWVDAALLSLGGGIALYNAIFMYGYFTGINTSPTLRCLQQVISSLIVPITYLYLSMHMNRRWFNSFTICIWAFTLLLLVPTGLFTLDGHMPQPDPSTPLVPMMFYFYHQGQEVLTMRSADVIILLQGLFAFIRVSNVAVALHNYHLSFSPRLRYLLLWSFVALIFVLYTSFHTTEDFSALRHVWTYYISYSFLATSLFAFLSLDLDLHPVMNTVTDEDDEPDDNEDGDKPKDAVPEHHHKQEKESIVEDLGAFIHQSQALAQEVQQMIDHKAYLDPNVSAESVIALLHTNRTYFGRMMHTEFGCTFTALITRLRMEHALHLLQTTELSIFDIAQQSGYADERSFSRRFRLTYGASPSKYRGGVIPS